MPQASATQCRERTLTFAGRRRSRLPWPAPLRHNRPVLDLIYGDYTFVNPVLARHYGMPQRGGDETVWVRVDDATKYGRGGLLPMAVFLTQSSPGLRTSPVKRGFWVVHRVLGETIPPPPPVVPELPADETKTDLPLPQGIGSRHQRQQVDALRVKQRGRLSRGYILLG